MPDHLNRTEIATERYFLILGQRCPEYDFRDIRIELKTLHRRENPVLGCREVSGIENIAQAQAASLCNDKIEFGIGTRGHNLVVLAHPGKGFQHLVQFRKEISPAAVHTKNGVAQSFRELFPH